MPGKLVHLLRVEGVNLGSIIDDTDQLSVRRGGGLMVLDAARDLQSILPASIRDRLTPIATGASIGLFQFEAGSDGDAEQLRQDVQMHLRDGKLTFARLDNNADQMPLRYATFVVDTVPIDERGAQQAEQLAVAKNRWRQLQQPSLSLDGLWNAGAEPCTLDRTRTATERHCLTSDDKNVPLCRSTLARWHYGRGARQKFYDRELGGAVADSSQSQMNDGKLRFTNDLQALSGRPQPERRTGHSNADFTVPDNLVDKLAVFYVDGNRFGARGREIFQNMGIDGYRAWSHSLREHHRTLLRGLIQLTKEDASWYNNSELRLETLLWGGDEILWVLPAWKGWEVAKWFFSQSHHVHVQGVDHLLTYGCGLVFCHAKAPIKNVTGLAHQLGDVAKSARPGEHALAYEVLESFDDISGDLRRHRERFLPHGAAIDALVLDPSELAPHWDTLTEIANSSEFPMRQLYMLTNSWRNGKCYEQHEVRLRKACGEANIDIDHLLQTFGNPEGWLHLLQILPYLSETQASHAGGQS